MIFMNKVGKAGGDDKLIINLIYYLALDNTYT